MPTGYSSLTGLPFTPPSSKGRKPTQKQIETVRARSLGNKYGLGKKRSLEWKEMMKKVHTGNKWGLGQKRTLEEKQKISEAKKGDKNPGWKGGITAIKYAEKTKIMHSLEYREWRRRVFERDHFTCVECGDNKGNNLQADHIKPWSLFPELRFDINNGRTLCVTCHRKTPTYGRGALNYVVS